jgi:hypothetical protein
MRIYILLVLMLTGVVLGAQTRRIAHRSHSGSDQKHYASTRSSYGYVPEYRMVKVHLESGTDTMVYAWDSLAQPYYHFLDTIPRAQFYPRDLSPKENIREMGSMTHKLIVRS